MHSVYETQSVIGIGSAVIIICCGQRSDIRFAEHHILVSRDNCRRLSVRLTPQISPLTAAQEPLTEGMLRSQGLLFAVHRLQAYVDERYLKSGGTIPFPSPVQVRDADDGAIRALRYAALCDAQLTAIVATTWCARLGDVLRNVKTLPIISTTELS